ncbi:MAG: anti-sigma factor [Bdellovibrionales bacterium]
MKLNTTIRKLGVLVILVTSQMALARHPDLKSAKGTVLIAAPTALNGPTNQGIWFINSSTKSFSLELPELPSDQVYEGWIVDDCTGKKVSTGLFRSNGMIDSDAAGKYAGPLALNFPPVPGSDFVTLGHDLADGGHNVVITVEPYPDSDPNPSSVGVLRANITAGATVGTEITLENIAH